MKIFEKTPFLKKNVDDDVFITPHFLESENNPCIIVCPGGGYEGLAGHEEYFELFNKMGLSVFVLHYRTHGYSYPCQYLDVTRAVRFVRYNAKKFNINPDKILIAGSSAGGHLAATAWCFGDDGLSDGDEIDKVSSKVNGVILCYPVISLLEHTHQGSSDNFSGNDDKIREKFSIQKCIKKGLSPVFLWHTTTDQAVDVENSLMVVEACHNSEVSAELHVFPIGWHGMGEAKDYPHINQWTTLCENWLKLNKFI